ncbi:MAG TPA: toll/interleukin-1 receptor domain-containing protein [Xanthobacteraceae bacterium]|nr:toll/interleukin-1 receptor domain-containing protein [Xanthobacteraceae bacterium]
MINFDAFISYSSKDKATADAACAALEAAGIRCWIAPRDITAGAEYGDALIEALDNCRVMVLIFSSNANTSPQIRREVERAVSRGVPVVPLRIENVVPTKAMAFFVSSVHWLDALTPPLATHLQRLSEAVQALLQINPKSISTQSSSGRSSGDAAGPIGQQLADPAVAARAAPREDALSRPASGEAVHSGFVRRLAMIGGIVIGVVALGALAIFAYSPRSDLDVNGTYVGTYTANYADKPQEFNIQINIKQTGSTLNSTFETSAGVRGVSNGTISGNVGTTISKITAPPNCPGTYNNAYYFDHRSLTFTFSGDDCYGHVEGQGKATMPSVN